MPVVPVWRLTRNVELLAAMALGCVYVAAMNGHLQSIDGLLMYRQGVSIALSHSLHFSTPIWWGGSGDTSKFGIGLSLLYVPGILLGSALHLQPPVQHGQTYDFSLLYDDRLYAFAGPVLEIVITAATAYLIARLIQFLGFGRSAALWGLALYGLGSPAIAYARGDVAQPLVGLCWIAALYAAVRFGVDRRIRWMWLCGLAQVYAIITRPVDGLLLVLALVVLVLPGPNLRRWSDSSWAAIVTVGSSILLGIALTGLVNWGRYGSPFTTGYEGEGWTTPLPVGLLGSLLSPGRGILLAFPAVILVPLGLRELIRRGHQRIAVALGGLSLLELINVATWHDWFGGWNWGLRLFVPALPLLAVLAATGIDAIPGAARRWLPALLLACGLFWAIPAVVTDLLGGYGGTYASTAGSFSLKAYPPIGAWAFFHHWRASSPLDSSAADILWLRLARSTSNLSLAIPLVFGLATAGLARRALGLVTGSPGAGVPVAIGSMSREPGIATPGS